MHCLSDPHNSIHVFSVWPSSGFEALLRTEQQTTALFFINPTKVIATCRSAYMYIFVMIATLCMLSSLRYIALVILHECLWWKLLFAWNLLCASLCIVELWGGMWCFDLFSPFGDCFHNLASWLKGKWEQHVAVATDGSRFVLCTIACIIKSVLRHNTIIKLLWVLLLSMHAVAMDF